MQRSLVTAGWRGDAERAPGVSSLGESTEEQGHILGGEPDSPVGSELEAVEAVEVWLRKLPSKHAVACRQIYLHGKTQGEAAEIIGCSKSRLSYLHKEAIGMLNDAWQYSVDLEKKKGRF